MIMRAVSAELTWLRKLVNPPYSVIDIFTIFGLLFILLTIPVITLNVNETRSPVSRANTQCSENLSYEVIGIGSSNTLKVDPGQSVSVKGTGLSGCNIGDKLIVRLWGFDNAPWQGWKNQAQCSLGTSSTGCTMTFKAPNSPDVGYFIQVTFDAGSNGSGNDGWTGWPKWLHVNKVTACTSKPTLSMSKTSGIEPGETITATVGSLSNCSGSDKFIVQTKHASATNWTDRTSCKPSPSYTKCNMPFKINQVGSHQVRIAYDKGGNGSIESYSNLLLVKIEKKIVQACSGTLNYSVNNQSSGKVNVNTGSSVTSKGTGLSNCTSSDKLYLQYWNWNASGSNRWTALGIFCTLSSSGTCSKEWIPSNKLSNRSWPTRMILNYSGYGTGSYIHNFGWVDVNIKQGSVTPPPTSGIDPPYAQKPLNCTIDVSIYFQPTHKAVDLTCSNRNTHNAEVRSVSSGTVVFNGTYGLGGYSCGYEVKIRTIASDGTKYLFRYCHLNGNISLPSQVSAGTIIGYADNSGYSFGSHLHLCLERNGDESCRAQAAGNQIDPRSKITGIP